MFLILLAIAGSAVFLYGLLFVSHLAEYYNLL